MSGEFKVISKRVVPLWRLAKKHRQVVAEAVMGSASVAGLVLLWSPWRSATHLQTAISFQLASGDLVAGALFMFMGVVLAAMAQRAWRAGRRASAMLMLAEIAALAFLVLTDPYSIDHLITFLAVAVVSAGWLVVLAFDLEDPWLGYVAFAGVLAVGMLPVSFGLGERALVTSCLVGMNLMFFRHFD